MGGGSDNRRAVLIAAGVAACILIAGCGGSAHVDRADSVIARAADVSVATGLSMDVSLNETVGGPSVVFSARGSFSAKLNRGSMMMYMQVPSAGGPATPMPIVIANGTIYERLPTQLASRIPGGRPWLSLRISQLDALNRLPGLFPFIRESLRFADPRQYLDFLGAAAPGSTARVGTATVNGASTTEYRAAIKLEKLPRSTTSNDRQAVQQIASLLTGRFHTSTMPVHVWIDRADRIRRLRATLDGSFAGHNLSIALTANITGHGSPPISTPPSAAETTNLLSLVQGLQSNAG